MQETIGIESEKMVEKLKREIEFMDAEDISTLLEFMYEVKVACDYDESTDRMMFKVSPQSDIDYDMTNFNNMKDCFEDVLDKPSIGPKMG